uniref:DNA-directed RNA polymerase III subunit RPC3 n=1 Tax=Setaria digitata TaxID=48799 RepID=A0A915PCX1_9BILA
MSRVTEYEMHEHVNRCEWCVTRSNSNVITLLTDTINSHPNQHESSVGKSFNSPEILARYDNFISMRCCPGKYRNDQTFIEQCVFSSCSAMFSVGRITSAGCRSCQTVLLGLLKPGSSIHESQANFKVRRQLKLRCSYCYFIRVDGRWEVRCTEYAKHHQKEPFNVKLLWMSSIEVDACIQILEDHFGPIVAAVGSVLLGEAIPLPVVFQRLCNQFRISEIRRAMIILEQHGILRFTQDERQRIIYSAQTTDILRLVRSARCSFVAKTLYGEIAEAICEEIISQGRLTCSTCIRRVAARLEVSNNEVKTIFARLAETQFVMRNPKVENWFCGCPIFEKHMDPFIMPDIILDAKKEEISVGGSRKRKNLSSESGDPDSDIYWRLNYMRFERYLRDEMVLSAYESGDAVHENCIKTLKVLLKISEMKADSSAAASFPISIHDVIRAANANEMNLERHDIEVSLRLLCESGGIVRKVGDSAGGLFVVDFEKAIATHCQRHIESAIREKLDNRAVRVFRLLLQKGFLEEDHVEKLAMLSSTEARKLCYQLLEKEFVLMKHMAKTNDFAPARTIYLYYVDLSVVAHNLYLFTCKVLRNVIIRRRHETKEHKVLIDRNLKMETIISNIEMDENLDDDTKKQQISEVEEMYLTSGDRATLERYRKGQTALICTEIELDHDILLYTLFLNFARRRV